jgi:glycosyltransferase involved in cell wall biosynthesis
MKICWLASWYPTVLSPFNGDFIQRHARAAALYNEIEVFHVVKDEAGIVTKDVKEVVTKNGNLTERIIYYKPLKTGLPLIDRFISDRRYKRVYKAALLEYSSVPGKPALVHVHVALKAGLMARWYQKRFAVPYIVTEHWAGFYDYAKPNVNDYNWLYKKWWRSIFEEAAAVSFVSASLRDCVAQLFTMKQTAVIPNVVDHQLFFPAKKPVMHTVNFIHASNMNDQKNVDDILKTLQLLKKKTLHFTLSLYGPVQEKYRRLVNDLGLEEQVYLKGEVPQTELAKAMQQSDALFESFGCVLIEANACGIPVIVSELPVFHELLTGGTNALFCKGEDPAALCKKLLEFISNRFAYNAEHIAATTKRYSMETVGSDFAQVYKKFSA